MAEPQSARQRRHKSTLVGNTNGVGHARIAEVSVDQHHTPSNLGSGPGKAHGQIGLEVAR